MRTNQLVRALTHALVLGLGASPVLAQPDSRAEAEAERASAAAPGDSQAAAGPGTEYHAAGGNEADEEEPDPTHHFNFLGFQPGHVFDYLGKDEYGGKFGDGQMVDTHTGRVIHEEEPASPPFIFMLFNFALLLGLLVWKGRPVANQVAEERHDQIKAALDEAAKLRQQAADKLAEYETRLKDADEQIKQMVDNMQADAKSEEARILAAAEVLAAQMKRDAEQRIAAEIELARARLTREVTAAAAAATEQLLRDRMTAADQQTLVSSFIADVQAGGRNADQAAGKGEVR